MNNMIEIHNLNNNGWTSIVLIPSIAIQIKKDWSDPYKKLGYVYLNKGNFNKSLEYFSKFIEIDPENPEVPTVKNIIATIEKIKK